MVRGGEYYSPPLLRSYIMTNHSSCPVDREDLDQKDIVPGTLVCGLSYGKSSCWKFIAIEKSGAYWRSIDLNEAYPNVRDVDFSLDALHTHGASVATIDGPTLYGTTPP